MFYLQLVESFDKYVQQKLDFNWNMLLIITLSQFKTITMIHVYKKPWMQ